jgi:hypothetical protein
VQNARRSYSPAGAIAVMLHGLAGRCRRPKRAVVGFRSCRSGAALGQVGRVAHGDEQPVNAQKAGDRLAPGLSARLMQQMMSALDQVLCGCRNVGHAP